MLTLDATRLTTHRKMLVRSGQGRAAVPRKISTIPFTNRQRRRNARMLSNWVSGTETARER
jgi:hypothetical protein